MSIESPQALAELRYEGDAFTSALGFSPAELTENRRGRIPFSQKDRLWKHAGARVALAGMAFVVLSAMAVLLVLVSVGVLRSKQVFGGLEALRIDPPVLYIPLAAVILIVLAVGVFIDLWLGVAKASALRRDLGAGHPEFAEGWASFSSELVWGVSLSTRCWLVVNNVRLEVTSGGPMELPARGPCRVYYTPSSRMVLSVEAI